MARLDRMLKRIRTHAGVLFVLAAVAAAAFSPVTAQSSVDLILHYVEGTPSSEKVAYDVEVYLSVLDGSGNPVSGLDNSDFSLTEDSRQVAVDSVQSAGESPLNLILVLDTSGSMSGQGIIDARRAAGNFLQTLGEDDQVAVLSFNDEIQTESDFTANLDAAVNMIENLSAVRNSGTCLYDAVYKAAQVAGTAPSGRRAVIVLTDGVDETLSGEVCSSYTVDDAIDYASAGNSRVPVYTIGVGNQIDERVLERLAGLTGGNYLFAPQTSSLENLFQALSDQFNSQYVITYTSTSARGEHSLVVAVNAGGVIDQDSRNFLLPALPLSVQIVSPVETEFQREELNVVASITGQGESVSRLVFLVDGEEAAVDDTTPYEAQVDFSSLEYGGHTITVRAVGEDESVLASDEITVTFLEPAEEPGPQPTTVVIREVSVEQGQGRPQGALIILAVVLLLVGSGVIAYFVIRSRKDEEGALEGVNLAVSAGGAAGILAVGDEFGLLRVLDSDDPGLKGQEFRLTRSPVSLGRSAENDVILPDTPISRKHARIVETLDEVQIEDLESRYGTFVNNRKVGGKPVNLSNGDEIRLGNRTTLLFVMAYKPAQGDDAPTFDELVLPDEIRALAEDPNTPELSQSQEGAVLEKEFEGILSNGSDNADFQKTELMADSFEMEVGPGGTQEMPVDDGTAEMEVEHEGTQEMPIEDGTREMEVEHDGTQEMLIEDGTAEMEVEHDGTQEMPIEDGTREMEVEHEGTQEMPIEDGTREMEVEHDGTREMLIEDGTREMEVESDHTREMTVDDKYDKTESDNSTREMDI